MMRRLFIILIFCGVASGSTFLQKPMLGEQLDWSNPINRGLVGCWLMNEGSGNTVYDLSGNRNTGTINAPLWVNTPHGPGLSFTGPSGVRYVTTGVNGASATTVSVWVRSMADDTGRAWGFSEASLLRYGGNWNFYSSAGGYDIYPDAAPAVLGEWAHVVCVVVQGDYAAIYFNGILAGTDTAIGSQALSTLQFGRQAATNYFTGHIAKATVWNRALAPAEIAALYADPYMGFADTELAMYVSGEEEPPATHTQVIMISAVPPILILTIVLTFAVEGRKKARRHG